VNVEERSGSLEEVLEMGDLGASRVSQLCYTAPVLPGWAVSGLALACTTAAALTMWVACGTPRLSHTAGGMKDGCCCEVDLRDLELKTLGAVYFA
jgi:hypothetical protein